MAPHSYSPLAVFLLLLILPCVSASCRRPAGASFGLAGHTGPFVPASPVKQTFRLLQIRGGDIVHPGSLVELETILEESKDKLVVIDFYSNNCAPCEKVAPLYQELSESEEFSEKVVFLKVNVDDHPFITAKYSVSGWPTFLFLKNGEVQTEIVGGKLVEATLYDWVRLLMPKDEGGK